MALNTGVVHSEAEPLLGEGSRAGGQRKKPFYRPRPLWCVPAFDVPVGGGLVLGRVLRRMQHCSIAL